MFNESNCGYKYLHVIHLNGTLEFVWNSLRKQYIKDYQKKSIDVFLIQ